MPGVNEEQVRQAQEIDLLTYLRHNEPHELVKSGPNEYRTKTYSSLVISNGMFYWNRGGFGGRNAIDYLMKIRGMCFVDAVHTITWCGGIPCLFFPACGERKAIGYGNSRVQVT